MKKTKNDKRSKIKPYSEEDYEDAKSKGFDLDNWRDYERYYELGEEEYYEGW